MTEIAPLDEWRRLLLPPSQGLLDAVADGYRDASLGGASMRRAVDSLEAARSLVLEGTDPFEIWDRLDGLVADVVDDPLQPVVNNLRERYADEVARRALGLVRRAFEEGPEAGWRAWVRTYAGVLAGWRTSVAERLVAARGALPESVVAEAQPFVAWTENLVVRRWGECEDLYRFCADNAPVTPRERAVLLVVLAQIGLYQYLDFDSAREALERADREFPEESSIWDTWGDYWIRMHDLERARECYERSIELDASRGAGYCGLGDYHTERQDLEAAEEAYLEATRRAPQEAFGYTSLIRLYARPELFEMRETRLAPLVASACAVDPGSTYDTQITLSSVYRQNAKYDRAEEACRTAIDLDEQRVNAWVELGDIALERDDPDRARQEYEEAMRRAPQLCDGYWSMAVLCEHLGEREAAISWYEQSVDRQPRLLHTALGRIAPLLADLGRHEEAGDRILAALRDSGGAAPLLTILDDLARSVYPKDPGAAVELYRRLRDVEGHASEAEFHRRVGELQSDAGDAAAAAESFREAIREEPDDGGLHRSLGVALRNLRDWEGSRREVDAALRLDRDEGSHAVESALIFNDEGNELFGSGDYRAALACYCRAVELNPDDAILQSNILAAWDRLDDPDAQLGALDVAGPAIAAALGREPTTGGSPLRRLERARELAGRYGAEILQFPITLPIVMEFADDLVPRVDSAQEGAPFLFELIPAMRERIAERLGFRAPGVRLRGNGNLHAGAYSILLFEVVEARGTAVPRGCCVDAPLDAVSRAGIGVADAVPAVDPVSGKACTWLPPGEADSLDGAGLPWVGDIAFMVRHLEHVLERYLALFFGVDDAELVLTEWAGDPELAERIWRLLPDGEARVAFARVLRGLLRERIRITGGAAILDSLGDAKLSPAGVADAIRRARLALRASLPGNAGPVRRIPVPDGVEELLRSESLQPPDEQRVLTEVLAVLGSEPAYLVARDPRVRLRLQRLLEQAGRLDDGVICADEVVEAGRVVVVGP